MKDVKLMLSASARTAIVSTFVDALNASENTGSLVTQVCDTANRYTKGEKLSDDDTSSIVNAVAKERGWKGASAKSRMSEVRVVLRAASDLPEAIKGFTARARKCDWHTAMRLARAINRGDSVKAAITHTFAKKSGQSPKSTPQGRTAAGLKAWYEAAKGDKRALIIKACTLLGLTIAGVTE